MIEWLLGIGRYGTEVFFYLLKLYICHTVIITTMFDLLGMQVLCSIIVATRKYYPLPCISAYALNQLICDPVIFVFKYRKSGFSVILLLIFQKLRESYIEDVFELIDREVVCNQSKTSMEISAFFLVLHHIRYK